jgi:hypothetical protein
MIRLYHKRFADKVDDYKEEAITLAHEFGHHQSHSNGDRPDDYIALTNRFHNVGAQRGDLTEEEARAIYDEEVGAWRYGIALLNELSFPDIAAAEARRDHGLKMYRIRLGWEDDDAIQGGGR